MARTTGVIDWEAVGKTTDLGEVVRILPAERVVAILGVEKAIEAIGLARVIDEVGPDKVLDALRAKMTPEQWQQAMRQREKTG